MTKLPDWHDSTKKAKFYEGLNDELKDALIGRVDDDDSFEQYARKCIVLDRQLEQRRLEKAGKRTFPSGSNSGSTTAPTATTAKSTTTTATGTQPGPMDLSFATRKKLTEEQKQYRRANNLCIYCGKCGHFVSSCPAKPAQRLAEVTATGAAEVTAIVIDETKK